MSQNQCCHISCTYIDAVSSQQLSCQFWKKLVWRWAGWTPTSRRAFEGPTPPLSPCWLFLFLHPASICLSSCSGVMNPLLKPQLHSSREPSCRRACGGYNELGVYPGFPDLWPMTSSIKEVLHLSEVHRAMMSPQPATLSPGPAGKQEPLVFTCFYLFS